MIRADGNSYSDITVIINDWYYGLQVGDDRSIQVDNSFVSFFVSLTARKGALWKIEKDRMVLKKIDKDTGIVLLCHTNKEIIRRRYSTFCLVFLLSRLV